MKSMRSIHSLIRCCMILLLLTSCYSKEERRVLVIHSYEKDYQGYAEFNKLIKKEFAKAHIPVELTFFYLNCEINNEQQEIDKINNFLDSISKWKPEVLLVNDDQATYSLLETHHPLLKGIPIVFSGVNYPNWELIGQYNNVTGFHDKIDFRKNLEMVHKLTGKNHIYTILDFTFLDRKVRNDIDNQLKSTDIISNLDWQLDKNDTRKEAEKGHIIVNALSARNLSKNQNKDQTKGGDFIWSISKYSTLPYLQTKFDYTTVTMASLSTRQRFTTINELFDCGHDFLGGYITPMHIQVEESVHAAARILNGENVADIPIQESAKGYFIDWNAMQKEHLTIADIPHEYTIINIPFKTRHPIVWWFALLGSITAIVSLLSGITYLYWRETKRKRSILYELEDEKESLALAVEGSDTYAWRLKDDTMVFEYAFWKNLGMAPHPLTIDGFLSFVDADYLDTERFMQPEQAVRRGQYDSMELLKDRFDTYMESLTAGAPASFINEKRAAILSRCREMAEKLPGFFSLTVPTGGGKTLASMAWALLHAVRYKKDRIIIVIPYTSIIVQTAAVLRDIFGAENVVEHHSNLQQDSNDERSPSLLATENWDAPIILTTNVQFFESLYACRTSRCRKLHNICNSVVILDEAQMLPVEFLPPKLCVL